MSSRWSKRRFGERADKTLLQSGEGSTTESDSEPDEAKSPSTSRRKLEGNKLSNRYPYVFSDSILSFNSIILFACFFLDGKSDDQGEDAVRNRLTEEDGPVQNVIDPEELEHQIPLAEGKSFYFLLIDLLGLLKFISFFIHSLLYFQICILRVITMEAISYKIMILTLPRIKPNPKTLP